MQYTIEQQETKLDISGNTPNEVIDDFEAYVNYNVDRNHCWFGEHVGSVIMIKLEDCPVLREGALIAIMKIHICFKGFLYKFQEIRIAVEDKDFTHSSTVAVIFGQQSRMM